MPAGNQAFHEIIMRARFNSTKGPVVELEKGYNEMSLSELRGEIARFTADREARKARVAAFRLHLRIALAGSSLALVCVLLASPFRNRGWRGLLALGLCAAYWALMFIGETSAHRGYLPPALGAWLPNISLVATGILVASSRSSVIKSSH
jgi:lipopolysaccharide export LptBFGC system permease protein LptF